MTFISYAQNFEDLMLWRALKHVENGFYIDVGANDPVIESVTKAFYDAGWRGINIEPLQSHIDDLLLQRPEDINLCCAVGDEVGEIDLFESDVRGWATAEQIVQQKHEQEGHVGIIHSVPVTTLAEICQHHVKGNIHFLKIDVEGFEKKVLLSADWSKYRPWIVVVEATLPNSTEEVHDEWEYLLLEQNYHFAYADGLNRFYISDEHSDLADKLKYPPNVFDDFIRIQQLESELKAQQAEKKAQQAQEKTQQAQEKAQQADAALHAVYNSRSWQLTAPLRWLTNMLRTKAGIMSRLRLIARYLLARLKLLFQHAALYVNRRSWLRKIALTLLARFPSLSEAMRAALREAEHQIYVAEGNLGLHPRVLPAWPTLPETLLLIEPPAFQPRWVRLIGHVEGHYSLAVVNRGLAGALEYVNQSRLSFVPYHGQPYVKVPILPLEQDMQLSSPLRRSVPAEAAHDAISVVHHYPLITDDEPAGLRGIIFFWEETSVSAETIDHLNRHFDVVWVAAESVKRALLNSGCRAQVFVVPIGVDHLIAADTEPLGALCVSEGQRLRFLHVSSAFERKGADVLLAAYLDAFTADDAVELYIKTFPNPHNHIHAQLEALFIGRDQPARVIIDEEPLDDDGMLALYRSAHAMVLPTRGEGFNLPAAEALAMALPVITTGHSAQADFCSHATATLVNFHFAASRSHVRASDACWLEPDRSDLTTKLQLVRQRILTDDASLQAQRVAGLRHVRETYRWVHCARSLLTSADWLMRRPNAEPGPLRLALVSPWDTRCGIAEYSDKLLRAMVGSANVQLNVYCDDRSDTPPANATVSWTMGNNASVSNVLERIGQSDAQVVLLQHQPSLFPLSDDCCTQLAALSRQGIVVMLELHSTLPLLHECRVSAVAISALAQIDRIIVHKPEDLNHLLALGLANNVMLLHLGVVQPLADVQPQTTRAELGIPADAMVLGCFGFALAHKGIDTLVETIIPLERASGRTVHLLALNSILDERSEQRIQQYRNRAHQLGLNSQIHWITDYRPIETCQRLLGAADYIVFPYKYTHESASGAVTIGLSTLKPVLVSPLDIFSDLHDVTWKMAGHEVNDIVSAVLAQAMQPEAVNELIVRQQQWLRSRDWNTLSVRLLTVMETLRRERKLAAAIAPARREWQAGWVAGQRKQLMVDVSELYYRDAGTGIQRVVRSILSEIYQKPPAGYEICPVYGDKAEGFRYTDKFTPDSVSLRDGQQVQGGSGDVFLGLDLAAHLFPEAEQHLTLLRLAGVRVYYVVYDIIPLRHAHFTVSGITQVFDVWLRSLARCADGLICISHAVELDVTAWLNEQEPFGPLPMIEHFHLGADMLNQVPTHRLSADAEAMLDKMAAGVSFLMVGTLEPRKGHTQVLDAFEQLWQFGHNVNLVIVGKQGWMVDALNRHIRSHAELNIRLFWLEGVSDQYLEKVYATCTCLIAASYCEGFGLPLIEAAQHKLPIIARDIAVFREVAGDYAYYFADSNDPALLAQALLEWLQLYKHDRHPGSDNMPWLCWHESTRQLLKAILPY